MPDIMELDPHAVLTDWECDECDHTEEEALDLGSKTTSFTLDNMIEVGTPICGECGDDMTIIRTYITR